MVDTKLIDILREGWIEIKLDNWPSDEEMLEVAESLGQIIPHPNGNKVDLVIPKTENSAILGSLSNKYGLGNFPMHTDTAFWSRPARYIVMSSVSVSTTSTTIVQSRKLISALPRFVNSAQAVFLVRIPGFSFYSRIIGIENGEELFRYDRNCMYPANNSAKVLMDYIEGKLAELPVRMVTWSEPKILILNNWAVLHGREAASLIENRIIKRIYTN